jgi:hypothetical protein
MIVTDASISQTKEGAGVLIRTLKKSEETKRPKIGDSVLVRPPFGLFSVLVQHNNICHVCKTQMNININIIPPLAVIRFNTNASWKMVKK